MGLLFVAHYSEVALKGKNRPDFVRVLRHNILRSLWGLSPKVTSWEGRFLISAEGSPVEVSERLSHVFGLAWFGEVKEVGRPYEDILGASLELAKESNSPDFRVEARRSDKSFPMSSYQLASKLGEAVIEATGKTVNLNTPGLTIHVDVFKDTALVYSQRQRGLGGLPVGTSGRVVHLFSGGIDSPPAAWLLMKRGCRPIYLHFYLAPTPEYAISSKVLKEIRVLAQYSGKCTVILVPFADYQIETLGISPDEEPSLFRRFMRLTAEALAPHLGASAISTGDALAQAASQTVWNIGTFDAGSSLPILRPLLAYDKEEVVSLAKSLGTYELSLEDYKDCCAIVSRHPKTRAKKDQVDRLSKSLDFPGLARKSILKGTLVSYSPMGGVTKVLPLKDALGLDDAPGASMLPMGREMSVGGPNPESEI